MAELRRRTRRRVSCAAGSTLTRRRKTCRQASCAVGPRRAQSSSARRPSAPTTPPVAVALERQQVARPGREQLGQGVLQQRQGAGLVADVGDDLGDEARLEAHADASAGPSMASASSSARGRGDRHHAGSA